MRDDWYELAEAIDAALEVAGPSAEDLAAHHAALDAGAGDGTGDGPATEVAAQVAAWTVDGERTAEWCLRKIRERRRRIAEVRAICEAEAGAILAYLERETGRLERDVGYFEGRLREWHERVLLEEPKRRTIRLAAGELAVTAGGLETVIDDEEALVGWLEEHLDDPDELVAYKPAVRKAELKARYKGKAGAEPDFYPLVDEETGAMLPGAKLHRKAPGHKVTVREHDGED